MLPLSCARVPNLILPRNLLHDCDANSLESNDVQTAQTCIRVVTGSSEGSSGRIIVTVDEGLGSGYQQAADSAGKTFYKQTETVLSKCYRQITGVHVQGQGVDGWVGSITFSTDGGHTYAPGTCTTCHMNRGSSTQSIKVDGNDADSVEPVCLPVHCLYHYVKRCAIQYRDCGSKCGLFLIRRSLLCHVCWHCDLTVMRCVLVCLCKRDVRSATMGRCVLLLPLGSSQQDATMKPIPTQCKGNEALFESLQPTFKYHNSS